MKEKTKWKIHKHIYNFIRIKWKEKNTFKRRGRENKVKFKTNKKTLKYCVTLKLFKLIFKEQKKKKMKEKEEEEGKIQNEIKL